MKPQIFFVLQKQVLYCQTSQSQKVSLLFPHIPTLLVSVQVSRLNLSYVPLSDFLWVFLNWTIIIFTRASLLAVTRLDTSTTGQMFTESVCMSCSGMGHVAVNTTDIPVLPWIPVSTVFLPHFIFSFLSWMILVANPQTQWSLNSIHGVLFSFLNTPSFPHLT